MPAQATDFIPAEFDASDWPQIEALLDDLQNRTVSSASDLERWLADRSELEAACDEAMADRYISMSRRTNDKAAQRAYTEFVEKIPPKLKPRLFELDKRFVELAGEHKLDEHRYEVILRDTKAEVELFRPDNVPIQTELAKLAQEYGQITGEMTVEFEGEEKTLPQMAVFQESPDRQVREAAWKTVSERRLQDADKLDELLDKMVERRHKMALNAGFDNFIGYAFKSKMRFDYGPEHCQAFHEACEKHVVPFNKRLSERRREALGVRSLRPWDLSVDPKGRGPLRPFNGGHELFDKSMRAFEKLDNRLAEMFEVLGEGLHGEGEAEGVYLDLDSRKGKAPGGYQYMRDYTRRPFIFMNAAGVQRDVETMVHEAGHAFHSMLLVEEPLLHYRHAPIEFCEVASMAMEFMTMPYWGGPDGFYPDETDHGRAVRQHIESSVSILSWIATIDLFQHKLYAKPDHSRKERTDTWLELDDRFGYMGRAQADFSGLNPRFRETTWQRQGHLYGSPFYYIEYGIAQLGAMGVWLHSMEKGEKSAIDAYIEALALGGSRPLPELFKAAGLPFDFGPDIVGRLVDRAERELEKLPE